MKRDAEIGIVGAGPAGARAAELLAGLGAEVLVLDPKAGWEKPCGGGLTPPLFDEMPEFDELLPNARMIERVRIEVSPEEGFTAPLNRPVQIISRRSLAKWQLQRAAAAGATLKRVKIRDARRELGGWRLDTDNGPIRVGFLVGADGGASLVRRIAAPKLRVELAPTRVAYPGEAGPTPDTMVLQFYKGLAGYLWDFPRPDHRSIGVGVPNGTWRRPRLDSEIDLYRDSSEPCSCPGLERAGAVIGTAQLGHGDFSKIGGDDYALLGDAAGLADPLTGEGIHNALRSANLFASAWVGGDPKVYAGLARGAFAHEFRVARITRRLVFETELATWLVSAATTSKLWYAAVVSVMNAINEHDTGIIRLLSGWFGAYRTTPRGQLTLLREPRQPVACVCGRCGPTTTDL